VLQKLLETRLALNPRANSVGLLIANRPASSSEQGQTGKEFSGWED